MRSLIAVENVERLIYRVRGQQVMFDADLADLYGVSTRALNQAVKRNQRRFPSDFVFQLNKLEMANWMSQFVTSKPSLRMGLRKPPNAFTEQGAIMAANVLNSSRAIQMSVFVVRAFVRIRSLMTGRRELAKELALLEKKITARLDTHETAIVNVLQRVMKLLELPRPSPSPSRKHIGFRPKR